MQHPHFLLILLAGLFTCTLLKAQENIVVTNLRTGKIVVFKPQQKLGIVTTDGHKFNGRLVSASADEFSMTNNADGNLRQVKFTSTQQIIKPNKTARTVMGILLIPAAAAVAILSKNAGGSPAVSAILSLPIAAIGVSLILPTKFNTKKWKLANQ